MLKSDKPKLLRVIYGPHIEVLQAVLDYLRPVEDRKAVLIGLAHAAGIECGKIAIDQGLTVQHTIDEFVATFTDIARQQAGER